MKVLPFPLMQVLPALAVLLAVSGCGSDSPIVASAPACPRPGILPDGGVLATFRPTGQDITDMTMRAEITGLQGKCGPDGNRLDTRVTVDFRATRGPAATTRKASFQYFVAVLRGDQVLDREPYTLNVSFPPNTDSVDLTGQPIRLSLPISKDVSGADYRIWAGLQLTPEQLQYNRMHPQP